MNNIILNEEVRIEDMIYEVRGVQVMLDSDLAKLYQVETKRINEAVKNNLEKFPERFSWILTENEWIFLRSKISTLENDMPGKGHHRSGTGLHVLADEFFQEIEAHPALGRVGGEFALVQIVTVAAAHVAQ